MVKSVSLGFGDLRLCYTLPLEDLYTALLLECGPPPPRYTPGLRRPNHEFSEWHGRVRRAMDKYKRHTVLAGHPLVKPNTMGLYVEWLRQRGR